MSEAKGHVLITGAAIRIGRVISLTLAQAGWDITIHYNTSKDDAETLAQEIEALGRKASVVQANLENRLEVEWLIQPDPAYPLTAIVNNASLFEHDTKDPNGTRHNMVNNEAPRLLMERLLAQLPADTIGSIVHILDNTPIPDIMSHYAASRARLQDDVAKQAKIYALHVRVNAVALGPTLIHSRQSASHFEKLVASTPLGQPSSPEAVAHAVLFLLENPAITGEILNIDSGMHLFSN